jgi:nucleotide-binding universal stress UspA family protein
MLKTQQDQVNNRFVEIRMFAKVTKRSARMFKRILVPLDGSVLAETALAPATVLAERLGAELLLVRTILTHVFPGADPGPSQLEALQQAERYLEGVVPSLKSRGIAVRTAIPYDAPALGIADQAEFRRVDLIVMSTHGRKWPDTVLHPSITMSVLEHTTAPLLVFKGTEGAAREAQSRLTRFMTDSTAPIIVPLDGSSLAESALPLAEELARMFGNPLRLVRAVEKPPVATVSYDYPAVIAGAEDWAIEETNRYLQRKQEEVAERGLHVTTESSTGSPAWFIEECIQAHNAGLVVMASHGRSGLGRLIMGSVAQSVLREGEVPVLLVRHQQPATR